MARYTIVYGAFVERLDEINLLRSKAARLSTRPDATRHGAEIMALCRASVVLLSSHVEAYVKELGEHTLDELYNKRVCRSKISPQFFYYISRERLEAVRSGNEPERIAHSAKNLFRKDYNTWVEVGGFPSPLIASEFNAGFSNPKFAKVKAYLSRFGYANFKADFFSTLGRDAQVIQSNLDQIVDTRNSIAHGDPSATKTPVEIQDMIETAKTFCRTTDTIFANWCRQSLCAIR